MESPQLLLVLSLLFANIIADDYQEGYTKLVVGTGLTESGGFFRGVQSFEVIDLSPIINPGSIAATCQPLPDIPEPISHAMGAFWQKHPGSPAVPYVCGGLNGFQQLEGCYAYDKSTQSWDKIPLATMSMIDAPRFSGVGWAAPGSNWFIHDGISGSRTSEREITLDRGQETFREYRIETGLNQDYPLSGHGMVRIFIPVEGITNDDVIRYYIAGGQNMEGTEFYNQTWLLDYLVKGQYSRQADMLEARSGSFFGLAESLRPVEEGEDGEQPEEEYESAMVMAGGFNSQSGHLDSTEIYSPGEDTWRSGGPLPIRVRGGMSVQLSSTLVAVGGVADDGSFSDKIFVWDNEAETWSEAAGVDSLAVGRAYGVAFLVADNVVDCA